MQASIHWNLAISSSMFNEIVITELQEFDLKVELFVTHQCNCCHGAGMRLHCPNQHFRKRMIVCRFAHWVERVIWRMIDFKRIREFLASARSSCCRNELWMVDSPAIFVINGLASELLQYVTNFEHSSRSYSIENLWLLVFFWASNRRALIDTIVGFLTYL